MSQISALELERYRKTLLEAHVPARQHSYYLRWLNVYQTFCLRHAQSDTDSNQLDAFMAFCQSRYADWQCQQAQHAVRLLAVLPTEPESETEVISKASESSAEAILAQIAGRVKCRLQNTVEEIIAIGLDLILAKEMLPRGQFCQWLRQEFEMSYPTANRMMRAADAFCDKVITVRTLSKRALYLLSAPDTSQAIRENILLRLEAGEVISAQMIEALKQKSSKRTEAKSPKQEWAVLSLGLERWSERITQCLDSSANNQISAEAILDLLSTVQALEKCLQNQLRPPELSLNIT